jgi:hypothetical protein
MSTPPRLPPELTLKIRAARDHHVMKVAGLLAQHFPGGGSREPAALAGALQDLTLDALLAIAEASYTQGLATAGDARQAIDDLATLRAAARILTGGR